jgi:hypothetical protein
MGIVAAGRRPGNRRGDLVQPDRWLPFGVNDVRVALDGSRIVLPVAVRAEVPGAVLTEFPPVAVTSKMAALPTPLQYPAAHQVTFIRSTSQLATAPGTSGRNQGSRRQHPES